MPDGFFSVCVSLYSSPITVTVLQNKDFDHRPSDFWQPQSKHQSANPAASAAAGIWISFQSLLKPSRCIMQYFNRKSNEKSIKFYENFLKKTGEFVHFWNKIFKPSEEKRKSEKTGEKSGRKTVKMTDEGSKATEEYMFVNSVWSWNIWLNSQNNVIQCNRETLRGNFTGKGLLGGVVKSMHRQKSRKHFMKQQAAVWKIIRICSNGIAAPYR